MRKFSLMAVLLICTVLKSAHPAPAQGLSSSLPSDFPGELDRESNIRMAVAPLSLKNKRPSASPLSMALDDLLQGQAPDLGVLIASASFTALLWMGRRRKKAAATCRSSN